MNSRPSSIRRCARRVAGILVMILIGIAPFHARAVVTQTLTDGSYQDFQKGTPKGVGVMSDGKIILGLAPEKLADIEADIIWTAVTGPDGRLYLGTGHEGRIYAVAPDGKAEIYCYMDEFEVTALVFGPDDALYAGTAPGGKIYRIAGRDQRALHYATGEESVWALAVTPNGTLYAATGSNGKIFKITAGEKGEEYYKADAKNVMDLVWSADGKLYALTHNKTLVLRIDEKGRAFVLRQADQEEGKALAMDRAGNLYVALNDGTGTDEIFRLPSAAAAAALIVSAALGGGDDAASALAAAAQADAAPPEVRRPTPSRSATEIIRITPEGYADSLWRSPESPIHAIEYDIDSETLFVAAGKEGRLYRVNERGEHTLLLTTEQKYITALARLDERWMLATAKDTAVFAAPVTAPREGEFISRALDASSTVNWGFVRVELALPEKAALDIALRSGNTKEPDDTWSEWSDWAGVENEAARPKAPVAQYVQYKARLKAGADNATPALDTVKIFYAQPNRPPELREINISKVGAPRAAQPAVRVSLPISLPGIQSGEQAEALQQTLQRQTQPTRANSNQKRLQVRWQARDLNNDALLFNLYLKGEDEPKWILIEEKVDKSQYVLDTTSAPDGPYRLKIEASDQPSNNPGEALTAELVSDRFVIDNTGPEFRELKWEAKTGGAVSVTVKVSDKLSLIEEVSYRVDGESEWWALVPVDQIYDDLREEFAFTLRDLEPGAHILAIQATDAEGNSTIERAIITVKE